jgi:hypothetical protein
VVLLVKKLLSVKRIGKTKGQNAGWRGMLKNA